MTAPFYSPERWREWKQQQAREQAQPEKQPSLLSGISPNAPTDDATLCAWNGERFVEYRKWLATAPLVTADDDKQGLCPRCGLKRPDDGFGCVCDVDPHNDVLRPSTAVASPTARRRKAKADQPGPLLGGSEGWLSHDD